MLRDEDKSANFLGALRGHAKFPLITFSSLEDQVAPQNSFIFTKYVDSIPTAPTPVPQLDASSTKLKMAKKQ